MTGRKVALAVVQARMTSSRLPGKVLAELGGRTTLGLLLERLSRARELDGVVVATPDEASDDPVAAAAREAGVEVVRGPVADVLERYRIAVEAHPCDAVVRITADCPLIDPAVVDLVVARWRSGSDPYVANVIEPRTFPKGMDVEVVHRGVLEEAAAEAVEPYDREHVTPFIRSRPERFPQARVEHQPSLGHVRMVLDTPEDLTFLRKLVDRAGPSAGMEDLLVAAEAV